MSPNTVTQAWNDLIEAMTEEDYDAIAAAATDVLSAYQSEEFAERTTAERAHLLRADRSIPIASEDPPSTFLDRLVTVEFDRARAIAILGLLESTPSEVPLSDARERLQPFVAQESALLADRRAASDVMEAIDLPGRVSLLTVQTPDSYVPLGDVFAIRATFSNVGDESTAAAAVTALATGAVQEEISATVGPFDIEATESVPFQFRATETGSVRVTIELEGGGASSQSTVVEIKDKIGLIDLALERLANLRERVETSDDLHQNRKKPLLAKLDAAGRKIRDAKSEAQDQAGKPADQMLNAGSNILGAFMNQVAADGRGKKKGDIPDHLRVTFLQSADAIIEGLATARSAKVS